MKLKEENCRFNKIKLFEQNIDNTIIEILLYKLYSNFCFSTFPYLIYKEESSYNSSKKFNSGNCIGFCYFIKEYLKLNYDIESFIVGASVPPVQSPRNAAFIALCCFSSKIKR